MCDTKVSLLWFSAQQLWEKVFPSDERICWLCRSVSSNHRRPWDKDVSTLKEVPGWSRQMHYGSRSMDNVKGAVLRVTWLSSSWKRTWVKELWVFTSQPLFFPLCLFYSSKTLIGSQFFSFSAFVAQNQIIIQILCVSNKAQILWCGKSQILFTGLNVWWACWRCRVVRADSESRSEPQRLLDCLLL